MGIIQSTEDKIQDSIINIEMGIANLEVSKEHALKRYNKQTKQVRKCVKAGDMDAATVFANSASIERNTYLNMLETITNMHQVINNVQTSVNMGLISKELSTSIGLLDNLASSMRVVDNTSAMKSTLEDINVKMKYFMDSVNMSNVGTNRTVVESNGGAEILEKIVAEEMFNREETEVDINIANHSTL